MSLTIGFARRVPTYKRLTLMLRDPARLERLLLDPERPIQLVIAGKAHPDDNEGKAMIAELGAFAARPEVRHRIVLLADYDMALARVLVAGVDVWLNNPLRPFEACGTSGMKAALNGALNLSILDGWWDERYDGRNGWAIPSADDGSVDPVRRDDFEAAALYDLVEREIVARFYGDRPAWLSMVRHTVSDARAGAARRADGARLRDGAVRARGGRGPAAGGRRARRRPPAGGVPGARAPGLERCRGGAQRAR